MPRFAIFTRVGVSGSDARVAPEARSWSSWLVMMSGRASVVSATTAHSVVDLRDRYRGRPGAPGRCRSPPLVQAHRAVSSRAAVALGVDLAVSYGLPVHSIVPRASRTARRASRWIAALVSAEARTLIQSEIVAAGLDDVLGDLWSRRLRLRVDERRLRRLRRTAREAAAAARPRSTRGKRTSPLGDRHGLGRVRAVAVRGRPALENGFPAQAIAAFVRNGPNSSTWIVSFTRPRPLTPTLSRISAPGRRPRVAHLRRHLRPAATTVVSAVSSTRLRPRARRARDARSRGRCSSRARTA